MANMKGILDTIRANASEEYQNRVPVAEQSTIEAVGSPILTYQTTQNEFLTSLIGRIAMTIIQNKTAKNPLAVLKKGTVPLGSDIQEIFTNMAKDTGFDGKGDKLLTRTIADVKVLYHRISRKGQYPVTISKQMLQTAFTSYNELEKMLSSIVTAMYSGDSFDEFILMKNLFANAISKTKIVKASVVHVNDETTGKAFIKAVKNASSSFTFPSIAFNTYYQNRPDSDKGDPITTWTPIEDQVLIIRSDVMNEIDVEVLAAAFNMDKVTFLASTLKVDSFGSATNCLAVLCDRSWVQVYDNLFETSEFYNGQGLYWNYWLNHWQTYSYSLFANAVAFTCDDETISLNNSTLTFTTTATQTLIATKTPSTATIDWLTSDAKVATVVDGVITPHANGKCVISAVNGDSVANCVVTVNIP
jgi:uncharacterized protein YjdB